jgi:hypothetical protein
MNATDAAHVKLFFMLKRIFGFLLLLLALLLVANDGFCTETRSNGEDQDTMEALIQLLKEKGVINQQEASKFMERLKRPSSKTVVTIVPEEREQEYAAKITDQVTERLKQDMGKVREEVRKSSEEAKAKSQETHERVEKLETKVDGDIAMKLSKADWTQRVRFGGDIRLRYQGDFFDDNNADLLRPDDPTSVLNTKTDRDSYRYRVRVGVQATLVDDQDINLGKVEIATRVATGNDKNPVSTNDTLGDYYNKDGVYLDQAYLKWTYKPDSKIRGKLPQASFTVGRMPNPFFYTDMVWDDDLNLEGLVLDLRSDTLRDNPFKAFLTAGAFPLQEEELSESDKWLYAGQIGLEYKQPLGLSGTVGVAYYDYKNIVGTLNNPLQPGLTNFTAPQFQQKGNTLFDIDPSAGIKTALASDYKLLNFTAKLDYDHWNPTHLVLTADYVKNLGFDQAEVARRTGNPDIKKETTGYQLGFLVGHPEILGLGDWHAFLNYKYLEADAVLDAFTDSDFHLGGTNAKGWILGGRLGVYKNVWLTARWFTADEIEGPPLAIDVLQVDLSAKY